mmetsp:Transcript_46084/g.150924  ORF Transcript_46084/g.150924 Transcript_46084/m.150924 type:complete len:252 (-) Transcript_46084:8-763(-)
MVRTRTLLSCFGMPGCLPPWSRTRPLTRRESVPALCCMCMISTMCRSSGVSGLRIVSTASTQMAVNMSASSRCILVRSEHCAIWRSRSRSAQSLTSAVRSMYSSSDVFASSIPSHSSRGCTPSERWRSACFIISPTTRTAEVVPSPVMSSCAVAMRAIMHAVGFWICISCSSVFPSLVSLMSPAPPTSILSVPLGPRLLLSTSCRPRAALMFISDAWPDLSTSAFGLSCWVAAIDRSSSCWPNERQRRRWY